MTKIMHSIPTHSIPRIFTSSAASTPPKVKASLDATVSYCGRSLTVRNTENFPQIGKVFKGSTSCVKEIFFPRTFNVETKLMQELVVDLINNFETVQFEFGYIATDVKVKYKGETYNFYDVMKKVKWDLISLDRLTLDRHLLNFKEYRYESSYYSVPGEVPSDKTYLYEKLHSAEKVAVNDYGTRGHIYNRFLRATSSQHQRNHLHFLTYLCKTAVLCSGLNKIPPSKEFDASDSYAYRCMSDSKSPDGDSIIETCSKKMKAHQKIKELGFTGVAYQKPQASFLGGEYQGQKSCLKVYENPRKLAKDISGLSGFGYECECLFLPNTKELIMREVVYTPESKYSSSKKGERSIFLTKVISKRQMVT